MNEQNGGDANQNRNEDHNRGDRRQQDRPEEDRELRDQGQRGKPPEHSTAERVTLGISIAVVATLVGLIVYLYLAAGETPAAVQATPNLEEVREEDERFYLPVDIKNTGGRTAQDVLVSVTLTTPEGEELETELAVLFLPGGAVTTGVVAFESDPREGEVAIDTISYLEP